jgi:protein-L-isoaspartate(D-aspartate) O-methyltransferase
MTDATGAAGWRRWAERLAAAVQAQPFPVAPAVLEALTEVPRHRLVPLLWDHEAGSRIWRPVRPAEGDELAWYERVYQDRPLVTRVDAQGRTLSSSSQPSLVARMLTELAVEPGQRVLEIGTGSGYQTALLCRLTGAAHLVTSLEIEPETLRQTASALQALGLEPHLQQADGRAGFAAHAPYDRIIVTASSEGVSRAWLEQLAPGGRLVAVLQPGQAPLGGVLVAQRDQRGLRLQGRLCFPAAFMPLRRESGYADCSPRPAGKGWPRWAQFQGELEWPVTPQELQQDPWRLFWLYARLPGVQCWQEQRQGRRWLVWWLAEQPRGLVCGSRAGAGSDQEAAVEIELRGVPEEAAATWQRLQEAWALWRRWQPGLEQYRLEADARGQRLWAETAGGWLIARATSWAEEEKKAGQATPVRLSGI